MYPSTGQYMSMITCGMDAQGDPCTVTFSDLLRVPICFIPPVVSYLLKKFSILHNDISS
jgi:hypothetical protein